MGGADRREVIYLPRIKDDLNNLDPPIAERILKTCEKKLGTDPTIYGKRLSGALRPLWRLRVGDYRVVFLLKEKTVTVAAVLPRPDAYKKLLERLS